MQLLLERGADVNARDKKVRTDCPDVGGRTSGHGSPAGEAWRRCSCRDRNWDVKYTIYAPTTVTLGKTGIPWNTDGEYTSRKGGQNALFFAVQKHDLESARLLLDAGMDVNRPQRTATTPLLAALYHWDPPDAVFIPGKGAPAQAGSSQTLHAISQWLDFCSIAAQRLRRPIAPATRHCTARRWPSQMRRRRGLPEGRRYGAKAALLSLGPARTSAGATASSGSWRSSRCFSKGRRSEPANALSNSGPAGDVRINPAPPGSSAFHIAAASTNACARENAGR